MATAAYYASLWDADTGLLRETLSLNDVGRFAFSPDDNDIAVCKEQAAVLMYVPDGEGGSPGGNPGNVPSCGSAPAGKTEIDGWIGGADNARARIVWGICPLTTRHAESVSRVPNQSDPDSLMRPHPSRRCPPPRETVVRARTSVQGTRIRRAGTGSGVHGTRGYHTRLSNGLALRYTWFHGQDVGRIAGTRYPDSRFHGRLTRLRALLCRATPK